MKKEFLHPSALLAQLALLLAMALCAPPAIAQCVLQPGASGRNGQTLSQNFFTLVDDLYAIDFHPTHSQTIGGKTLQIPPWFKTSDNCEVANLKNGSGAISPPLTSPSYSDYLVVSDELSELAVVTAVAASDSRMMAIHNTIQAMIQGMVSMGHPALPCWLAEVSGGTLTCRALDSATDATVRFGLAYYHAANNPAFPATSRTIYRTAGDALATNHLAFEYAHGCYLSSVTQQQVCDWVGGGANTAAGGVGSLNFEMFIGYFQDVARFLLAAYVSTGNSAYLTRAGEVVDQWLIASGFDGTHLTFGHKSFGWDTTAQPIAPRAPNDPTYWQQGRAWEDSDAPRALWMGDVLRAIDLVTSHAPLTGAYANLSAWVQLVLQHSCSQTATTSCIQYNQDASVVICNCNTDFYNNGLGAGLSTYDGTSWLASKLDTALSQFGWNASPPTWNSQACFGIYRGVRPVKALAAAIGLDAATWGGTPCGGASATLTVTETGTGSGTVTSSPAGISCPGSCAAAFAAGTGVTLSAAAAPGSNFTGWGGACSGTGGCTFTLNSDQAVTATFTASGTPPAAPTWLRVTTVSASELKLTWQDNSNNESGFKVERKQGCCGPWTPLPDAPANSTGTATYESTGLLCGTTYAYHVWAFNAAGASAQTNEAAASTSACP